jgi:hypothetical protein
MSQKKVVNKNFPLGKKTPGKLCFLCFENQAQGYSVGHKEVLNTISHVMKIHISKVEDYLTEHCRKRCIFWISHGISAGTASLKLIINNHQTSKQFLAYQCF